MNTLRGLGTLLLVTVFGVILNSQWVAPALATHAPPDCEPGQALLIYRGGLYGQYGEADSDYICGTSHAGCTPTQYPASPGIPNYICPVSNASPPPRAISSPSVMAKPVASPTAAVASPGVIFSPPSRGTVSPVPVVSGVPTSAPPLVSLWERIIDFLFGWL